MSVRLNPDILPDLLASIEQAQQNQQTAVQQMSTGRSVNNLSDNPAAAAALVGNDALSSENDQFLTNVSDVQGKLQAADSALNNAGQCSPRPSPWARKAPTAPCPPPTARRWPSRCRVCSSRCWAWPTPPTRACMSSAAPTSAPQPFAQDASASSGVQYNGNSGVTSVQIAEGQSVQTNVAGNQLFLNSSGNVFGALNDLANALTSGNGIAAANTEVQQAFSQLTTQRVSYGNALSQLQSSQNFLNQEQVNLSTPAEPAGGGQSDRRGRQESQDQVDLEAALTATSQVLSLPSLLSYLK